MAQIIVRRIEAMLRGATGKSPLIKNNAKR